MKANTYISSGYKYGLVCNPEENLSFIGITLNKCCGENNEEQNIEPKRDAEIEASFFPQSIIPFDSVDGLSLRELQKYYRLKYNERYLVFIMYDSIPISKERYPIESTTPVEEGVLRYLLVIDTEKDKEATIDEVVEKHLVSHMNHLNLQNRRKALGFLEKYVYGDRISTMEAIDNYLRFLKDPSIRPYFREYVKLPERLIDK